MRQTNEGWLLSLKTIVITIAAIISILSALLICAGWGIGLYNGLDRRMTVQELNYSHMGDDIKEMKSMMQQLFLNRVDNRPEVSKWAK